MDKKEVIQYLESHSESFNDLSDRIWDNPETCFEEKVSAEILCNAFEKEGFEVKRGVAGMGTAFTASFGSGKPVIGFLGEYDALPSLSQTAGLVEHRPIVDGGKGHGCGHNLLGVGALEGAFGLKKYIQENNKEGTVIYFGCPAEEGGAGKTFMAREGCFNDVDCALSWHPGDTNMVQNVSTLANNYIYYRFSGKSAHAAASPHMGRSALDAVELMNVGAQFLREHIITDARVHYAITNTGGNFPNVVQDYAEVLYQIRAPHSYQVREILQRVNKIAQGAALMTETQVEHQIVSGYSNIILNSVMEELLYKNMTEIEMPQYTEEEMEFIRSLAKTIDSPAQGIKQRVSSMSDQQITPQQRDEIISKADEPIQSFIMPYIKSNAVMPASSDVGDVSWNCPTAQCTTATWISGTIAHTWQVVTVGKSASAHKATLYAGKILASTAIDLLDDPDKIKAAKEEFKMRLGGESYICPIPPETTPADGPR